ncbi:MAG: thiamine-phosphate kinase [Hyphomicrobium sp.]
MSDKIANETELIQTYLAPLAAGERGALGLKDDAAYITPPPGTDLVITTDPIIAGVHFFSHERADDIAWKAIAVNISDLAAKGAAPLAYTMALAFHEVPGHAWMALFARGLADAQEQFGCTLVGGDTDRTSGPLSVSVTAFGAVPAGRMVLRNGARIGDHVFVTGTLGDAALGLALHRDPGLMGQSVTSGDKGFLVARYLRPAPRLALAPLLREFATGSLDISDGLAKDLARLAAGAGGRADVGFAGLPLSPSAQVMITADAAWASAVISGGDDYEVIFAVSPGRLTAARTAFEAMPFKVTEIGRIGVGRGVLIRDAAGRPMALGPLGYDHFS